jgi:hypothetical protein
MRENNRLNIGEAYLLIAEDGIITPGYYLIWRSVFRGQGERIYRAAEFFYSFGLRGWIRNTRPI